MSLWKIYGTIPGYADPQGAIGSGVDLGAGVRLEPLPAWARSGYVKSCLSFSQRNRLEETSFAFLVERDVDDLSPRIEKEAGNSVRLANLAAWIARPSPLTLEALLFFDRPPDGNSVPSLSTSDRLDPLPSYRGQSLDPTDLSRARDIHIALAPLSSPNILFTALRALWRALLERSAWEVRYTLYWIAIEALFGADQEIRHRIALRGAFFLESDRAKARKLFEQLKDGYKWRSAVVHGNPPKKLTAELSTQLCEQAEAVIQRSLFKILTDSALVQTFSGRQQDRGDFLDGLVFQ